MVLGSSKLKECKGRLSGEFHYHVILVLVRARSPCCWGYSSVASGWIKKLVACTCCAVLVCRIQIVHGYLGKVLMKRLNKGWQSTCHRAELCR